MQKITPFLWFNGKAEEAMTFYTSVFKDSKIVRISHIGGPGSELEKPMISGTFEINGQQFHVLDGGPMFQFTPAVSFFVNCENQEEVDELWDKLSVGGEKGRCGWLKDQYGLSWQIIPTALGRLLGDPDPKKSRRVLNAMMKMDKIIISELENA